MRKSYIILLLAAALSVQVSASCSRKDTELESALAELDAVMARQGELAAAKTARIDSLRLILPHTNGTRETYAVYDALFQEYVKWDTDSAFAFAHRKEQLAERSGIRELINDSYYDLSFRYCISGSYHDALAYCLKINSANAVLAGLEPSRLYLLYDIYHGLVQSTRDEWLCRQYREQEAECLRQCRVSITDNTIEYYNTWANILISEGKDDEVIELMQGKLSMSGTNTSDRAMLHYWTGKAYSAKGDERNALLHYAYGARYDFMDNVKSYGSPILVTQLCYDRGDIQRAYRYVMRNYDDALHIDAHYRVNKIAEMFQDITDTYERAASRRRNQLMWLVFILLILLAVLGIALLFLRRSRNRLHKANQDIILHTRRLQESNNIKDAYLGQFLSMFSEHIDSLERYRSSLRVSAKQMDFGVIQQELRSDDFINAEWAYLYDKFDKTFLGLFPDFVEKLNNLIEPDSRIGQNLPEGHLTNELRIFALIRLGVADSSRIAKFLRLSLSTVYNYRVKLRNAAICKRDDFEPRLMKIGA